MRSRRGGCQLRGRRHWTVEGTACKACPLRGRRGGDSVQDSEEVVAFGGGLVGEAEAREGGETKGPKLRVKLRYR